jgi:hypothetical protein
VGLFSAASAVVGVSVFGGVAVSNSIGATAPASSLTVGGSPKKPVVTIAGQGLRVPAANPAEVPTKQAKCKLKVDGNPGLDYGTQFYLLAWAARPSRRGRLLISAGRYRPALGTLDCIGIVVLSQSPTKVTFGLGGAYAQYYSPYWIQNGDVVEVVLNGDARATVVHY